MRLPASATVWCLPKPKIWQGHPRASIAFRPVPAGLSRCNSSTTASVNQAPIESAKRNTLFDLTRTADGQDTKPFFITTPIFYVNASPHVGHLHSLVLSDVIARYSRLRYPDRPVIFSTGTDEHGLKIQQAAAKGGIDEQTFCDQVSERFRDLAAKSDISHTTFIRTSSPEHHLAVEHFWARLVASGDIYKGTHSGWYSVSDECFYSANQVKEGEDGKTYAVETGNEVFWEEEENWKFRLGSFKDKLTQWASREGAVQPDAYQNEILAQLPTLEDLSISRPASRVKWGVPVPSDPEQTIYVWVDALINYITVLGYPGEMSGWPADVHLVGKDIIRFHAIHWPALLMSAGLPPPRHVLAHAHWTMSKAKMSKSKGNVVDPIASMSKYGVDVMRWYLMRAGGGLPSDADYSEDELIVSHRQLLDRIGNLVSRISPPKLLAKMQPWIPEADQNPELDGMMSSIATNYAARMEDVGISKACEGIMDLMISTNKMLSRLRPWQDSCTSSSSSIVYAYHALRLAAILLQPIIPAKSGELLDRLGIDEGHRTWQDVVWNGAKGEEVDVETIKKRLADGRSKQPLFPTTK